MDKDQQIAKLKGEKLLLEEQIKEKNKILRTALHALEYYDETNKAQMSSPNLIRKELGLTPKD